MTVVVEFGAWDWLCVALGLAFLLLSLLSGLGYERPARALAESPLGLALVGAASTIYPFASDIANQGPAWVTLVVFLCWAVLLIGGSRVEIRAKRSLSHNQSLQPTVDPAGSLADAKAPSASTASEHRRYAAPDTDPLPYARIALLRRRSPNAK